MLPARAPADEVILRRARTLSCNQHCPQSYAAPHDPSCRWATTTPSYAGTPATPLSTRIGEVSEEFLLQDVPLTPVATRQNDVGRRQSAIEKFKAHVRKLSWAVARKEPKDSGYVSRAVINFDGINPFSDHHAIRESEDTGRAREDVETVHWSEVDDRFAPLVRVRAHTEPFFPPVKKRSLFDRVFRRRSAPNEKTAPLIKRRHASWRALVLSPRGSTVAIDEEETVFATAEERSVGDPAATTNVDPIDQGLFDELCLMLQDRLQEREESGDFDTVKRDTWFGRFHGNQTTPDKQAEASRKLATEVEKDQKDRMRKFRRQQERLSIASDPESEFRGRQIKRSRHRAISMPLLARPHQVPVSKPTRTESESDAEFKLWCDSEMDVAPDSAFNPID